MVRRVLGLTSGRIAIVILGVIVVLAVAGPLLAPHDSLAGGARTLAAPSAGHWLGTDYLGRDVFSRLLDGSRVSVVGSVEVATIALVVGAIPGILSGFPGR